MTLPFITKTIIKTVKKHLNLHIINDIIYVLQKKTHAVDLDA